MIKRIRLKASRTATLIHIGILIAHKNSCKEDEWPNFEFYPGKSYYDFMRKYPDHQNTYIDNKRPFRFKMRLVEILKELYPG